MSKWMGERTEMNADNIKGYCITDLAQFLSTIMLVHRRPPRLSSQALVAVTKAC